MGTSSSQLLSSQRTKTTGTYLIKVSANAFELVTPELNFNILIRYIPTHSTGIMADIIMIIIGTYYS